MRNLNILIRTTSTFIQYRVLLGNKFSKLNELFCNYKYRIGGVMVSELIPKTIKLVFVASLLSTALRRKSKYWLARNQNNVSE
jgi:hypothetical protein